MYCTSGVVPKTLSEYRSEQMDSVEMLGKKGGCVPAWEKWRGWGVCVQKCSSQQRACPEHTGQCPAAHRGSVYLWQCAGSVHKHHSSSTEALLAQGWHISYLDLGTFLFRAHCPLQGILNFLWEAILGKLKRQLRIIFFKKAWKKYLILWLCQLSYSWNADYQPNLLILYF